MDTKEKIMVVEMLLLLILVGVIIYTSYQYLHPQKVEAQKSNAEDINGIGKYSYERALVKDTVSEPYVDALNLYGNKGCILFEVQRQSSGGDYLIFKCPN